MSRSRARAASQQDDGDVEIAGANGLEQLDAVAARHIDVREHQVKLLRLERLRGFVAIGDWMNRVAARRQRAGQGEAQPGVIIGEENPSVYRVGHRQRESSHEWCWLAVRIVPVAV